MNYFTPPLTVRCSSDTSIFFHHALMSRLHMKLTFSGSKLVISTPMHTHNSHIHHSSFFANCAALAVTQASETSSSVSEELSLLQNTLPRSLWAMHKDDVGFVQCESYVAKLKHLHPVFVKQYPLSEDKARGIDKILSAFLDQGVVVPGHSSYNTPVNSVPKPNGEWRFTQDLRKINDLIIPVAPVVPDILGIMSSIPHSHSHFSVVDICSAFFSVPVSPCTQPLFAFTHRGAQYTWTRLPQGFIDSLAVFSAVVHSSLQDLVLPEGAVVLQYADDLLISSLHL
ncbi:MAG: reverse transcriptase domain-containing protein [Cetobacterium sp.]